MTAQLPDRQADPGPVATGAGAAAARPHRPTPRPSSRNRSVTAPANGEPRVAAVAPVAPVAAALGRPDTALAAAKRDLIAPPTAGADVPTYEPSPYDPRFNLANRAALTGHPWERGIVAPAARRGRLGAVFLLVAAMAAGLFAWRALSSDADKSSAATRVAYRSVTGHFSAKFPGQPVEAVRTQRYGRVRVALHTVALTQNLTAVQEADVVSGALPRRVNLLTGMLRGLTTSGELTLLRTRAVRFQGHPARQADYASLSGRRLTALIVRFGRSRFYLLAAPSGTEFAALAGSFTAGG